MSGVRLEFFMSWWFNVEFRIDIQGLTFSVDMRLGFVRLICLAHFIGHNADAAFAWAIAPVASVAVGAVSFVTRILSPARRKPAADREGPDAMRHSLGRMAEYLDGLAASEPPVREPFELSLAAMRACRWDEAVAYFREAMAVTEGVHLVALRNLIGVCRYTQGLSDAALEAFEESARLAQGLEANRGRAQALNNIGLIYRDRGELDRALVHIEESMAIARQLDDLWAMAIQLGNAGNIWHEKGDLDKALDCHERALTLAREIGDQWSVASELANIGSVHLDKGDADKALKYDQEALAAARCVGYRLGVATGLANIADIHRRQGRFDEALKYEEEALGIARRAGYTLGVAVDLGNIGLDLMIREKHEEAVPKLAEALTILLSVGVADGPRQALTGLVRCEDKLGRQRVETLLKGSGLSDGQMLDLLDRIDQMRMRRPVPASSRQLRLQPALQ
jgi:tetratricopeptide (TPR) repeat protein